MAKKKKAKMVTEQEPIGVESVIENANKIIEKKEVCKVKYSNGLMYINFKGYGLTLPNIKGYTEPEIEVFYEGEIGKANFKFRV